MHVLIISKLIFSSVTVKIVVFYLLLLLLLLLLFLILVALCRVHLLDRDHTAIGVKHSTHISRYLVHLLQACRSSSFIHFVLLWNCSITRVCYLEVLINWLVLRTTNIAIRNSGLIVKMEIDCFLRSARTRIRCFLLFHHN